MLNLYVEDILDLGRIQKGAFQLDPVSFKVSFIFTFSSMKFLKKWNNYSAMR
jgi:hypothetical protein